MAIFASDSGNPRSAHHVDEKSMTIDFIVDPKTTKMFAEIEDPEYYSEEAMTYNNRNNGISLDVFTTDSGLGAMFTPTSTTTDPITGDTVVATMESPNYPFYGTQFHPEKAFTMYNSDTYDHSWASVHYNRYFGDRFVELARQNANTCGDFDACYAITIDSFELISTNTYHGNVYAF